MATRTAPAISFAHGGDALAAPRTYGAVTLAMLWGGLMMSMLAFVPGAYLVPALTLRDAVLVAAGGSVAGAGFLATVAAVAARRRQNTVGLISSVLGVPAGPFIALALFARHACWAMFMVAFASEVAAQVPALGGERWAWALALAAGGLALALLPPAVFVGRWMGWFAFWVGLLMIALITMTGISEYGVTVVHDADGLGGWPSRAQGFDLIAALPLLWVVVVADYAMDARSPRDAALGTGIGAGAMTAWYAVVGVLWVFTVSTRDVAGFITALPLGATALLIVVALEADAVAANLHAASQAGGRFGYRWFRPALVIAAIGAGAVAVGTDGLAVEDALITLAAITLPLMAVVVARAALGPAHVVAGWTGWLAGALAYGWINPGDYEPWRDAMDAIFGTVLRAPFPLGGETTPIPATIVSIAVAGAIYAAGVAFSRWRRVSDG